MRIDARGYAGGVQLGSVFQHDSRGRTVARENAGHGRVGPNLGSLLARCGCDRVAYAPHPAPHVTPDSPGTVAFAHDMMKQDVSGAGHRWRSERPDDGIRGQRDLELFRLEPPIQNGTSGAGQDLDGPHRVLAQLGESEAQLGELDQVSGSEGPRSR